MTVAATKPFDLLRSPLQGTNLIEASAGTGKTYAIAGIFLRLLLEGPLTVSQILVVTFTKAATEELRDRIRRKIREAIEAFASGGSKDRFLDGLVQGNPRPAEALRLLREALRNFDEAPIHTIHSFCQRTLHENAFESMSLFDTELVPDEAALREEVVQDFWRRHFYAAPREFVAYALEKKLSIPFFLKLIRNRTTDPDLRIVPEASPASLASLEPFREAFGKLVSSWEKSRAKVLERLQAPGLHKGKYKNPDDLVAAMDRYAQSEAGIPLFKNFGKFTASGLRRDTNKGQITPRHPFFDLCEDLYTRAAALTTEMEGQLLFLKGDIFRYLREQLPQRKRRRNLQSYDDLLLNLRSALEKPGNAQLAGELRGRYRAALIDEFQDTDPIQYAIFQSAFGHEEAVLFLIGDPKQAIYSFRGADLFAYVRASQHVDTRYTLLQNWRSEPGLIEAVNTVFSKPGNRFLYEEIPFAPAVAGEEENPPRLTFSGMPEPPLQVWLVDSARLKEEGAATHKDRTRNLITTAVAAEIARLLRLGREGKARIGEEPLREGDIAVLVRTNTEARLVQDHLKVLGIPAVLHSAGNIFDTPEALEMERVLAGIAEPSDERLLRTALATDMMGTDGQALEALLQDERGWEDWIERFRQYSALWERAGFIRMFSRFLLNEHVRERLLSFPDGERRLTNLLHLAEILHTEASERRLGTAGLLKWLARQRDPDALRLEEHELRLESDAKAVKIVTIHKSKGLEYPVVFCPFNWSGSRIGKKDESFIYHDREDNWRPCIVVDTALEERRPAAEREMLAENVRLLYVSLTRAKHRCYLIWGPFKDAGTSSLAWTLHPPEQESEDIVDALEERFEVLTDGDIRQDLEALSRRSDGILRVSGLPAGPGVAQPPAAEEREEPSCRAFSGHIERNRRIASFSYIMAGRTPAAQLIPEATPDLADHDGTATAVESVPAEAPAGIFAFPKGARAGTFLHDIFEHLDFADGDAAAGQKLVAGKLMEYGFGEHWQETLYGMIGKVLAAPLQPQAGGFSLSRITQKDRLSELEFYFPLKAITPDGLRKLFAGTGGAFPADFPERIGRLDFRPAHGFMKGYMDLVFRFEGRFYLVDWKSNFLGSRIEDYNPERLAEAMAEDFYILQYHLYVLALHQYLKQRLPGYDYERHFGGVFYIFLRGVDPEKSPGCGIFRDRPARQRVEALAEGLIA